MPRWIPLAVCCSYVSHWATTAAFPVVMPAATGVKRAVLGSAGGVKLLSTTAALPLRLPLLPSARRAARRVFQQRMMSSSTSQQQQVSTPPSDPAAAAPPGSPGNRVSKRQRQRASTRYIPSDFRGVWGGPKGKWKARLVSKGQLRQLGTFESERDAARAYNKAARSLHGAGAKLNLLPDDVPAKAPQEAAPETTAEAEAPAAELASAAEALAAEESAVAAAAAQAEREAVLAAMAVIEEEAAQATAGVAAEAVTQPTRGAESLGGKGQVFGNPISGATAKSRKEAAKNGEGVTGAPEGGEEKPAAAAVAQAEAAAETAGVAEATPRAAAATADFRYQDELDFRDLEEIPESTGPSFWGDDDDATLASTWATTAEPEGGGGGDDGGKAAAAPVKEGSSSSSSSSVATTAPTVPDRGGGVGESSPPEHTGLAERGAGADATAGAAAGESEPGPDNGIPPGNDESAPVVPSPTSAPATSGSTTPTIKMSRAAAGMASVGGEAKAGVAGRRRRRSLSTLASSQQAKSSPLPPPPASAAVGTGTSGSNPPVAAPPRPPSLVAAEGGEGATSVTADVAAMPGKAASEGPPLALASPETVGGAAAGLDGSGQREGGGANGMGGGEGWSGEGGAAETTGAWSGGGAGWERDEAGEDVYEENLKALVGVSTGPHGYWMGPLMALTKPETRKTAMQLTADNKLGYRSSKGGPVSKGTLLQYVLEQKEKHPTKVLLTRVGEFYETYGVDAVMMMQHAGLNKMGQEIRAGCPRRNVQQTIDGLTGAGLTVAVYEEMNDVDAQRGPSAKKGIKERALSQVLSPGSPNYLYEGCLRTDDISFRESKPYVGVMKDSSGYLLCQIYPDEREVQVSERMTAEAVRVAIEEAGVAEPVFDQGTGLAFLPDHTEPLTGFPSSAFPGQILARVARLLELAESDLMHFRTVTRSPEGRPRPVYPSTALQIGLLKNKNVPDLVPCLLPAGYPAACHRFLRKWLLLPPSYRLADSAHNLCKQLASPEQAGLPPLHAVPVGKAKALLLDRQCNVPFFREIHQCVSGMLDMLGEEDDSPAMPNGARATASTVTEEDPDDVLTGGGRGEGEGGGGGVDDGGGGERGDARRGRYAELLPHLLDLVAYQSGVDAVEDHLRERAKAVIRSIEAVVAAGNGVDDITSDPEGLVPEKFWWNNEVEFRGSLSLEHEATKKAYGLLHRTASELCTAVKEDFPNAAQDLTFDIHNNAIFLTKLPANSNNAATRTSGGGSSSSSRSKRPKGKEAADGNGDGDASPDTKKEKKKPKFLNPHDRNGKLLPKRFTTERVSTALSGYLTAIEETKTAVQSQLQALSDSIVTNNDLPVIAQAAHWSVICQAMEGHVRHALSSGWSLPSLKDLNNPDMSMKVENLVPYWLPRQEAVPNSFDFGGLFLLTAPNMSGKSTLMRAVLACSLLSNAGLFAPCTSAVVPRFDCFFLRTASYDIPAEDKSAFALEMDDVRVMLRDSSDRSLALVDELGKGTSARDGASLAGAILEEMDRVSITGIFATHLHELFELPLETESLTHKRMGIDWDDADNPRWTYTMEDGKCTDSLALQTAKKYNIPASVIARAQALSENFDQVRRGGGGGSSSSSSKAGTSGGGDVSDDDGGDVWWPSEDGDGWGGGSSAGGFKTMKDATQVVCRVADRPHRDLISVESGYGTPPALEGRSCLYVLRYSALLGGGGGNGASGGGDEGRGVGREPSSEAVVAEGGGGHAHGEARTLSGEGETEVGKPSSAGGGTGKGKGKEDEGEEEAGVWFYVGESDCIRERLKRHAKRWGDGRGSGGGGGARSFKLDAVVVPVENRSEARRLETALIRAMKDEGFHLVSDKDGSRTHFSSWK